MYRYQVNFDKVFTAGNLEGLRYTRDYLRFTDWHSADAFAQTCDGKTVINPCVGNSAYVMECPILTAI